MKNYHPLKAKPDATPAIAAAALVSTITFLSLWLLLHGVAPFVGWDNNLEAPITIDTATIFNSARLDIPDLNSVVVPIVFLIHLVTRPAEWLIEHGVLAQSVAYLVTALVAATICGTIAYRAVFQGLPPARDVTTVEGSEPLYGRLGARHINKMWRDRRRAVGDGLRLAPGVVMPRDVEAEHVAVMGTTGAGKTTIVDGLLRQAIRRGDRALIVDVKGNANRRFGITNAGELALGSSDGLIWAIGLDIRTRQDAIELAAILIPPSKDPIWSDGARLYLVGLIVALQRRLGVKWGWRHLRAALAKSFSDQERLIRKAMPDIVQLLQSKEGDPTVTVMSILVTIVANVGSIAWTLAEREKKGGAQVSLRSWAAGKSKVRVIFLRLEFDRESQSAAFLKLALRCVQATLLGDDVRDGVDHAIWLGFDELPRYCDDQTVERLVALGRSRGVRIVAALQVPASLRKALSADATASLLGNFGLQIISRVAPGPSRAEIAREWFGTRTVTWNPALTGGDKNKEWPTKDIPVLSERDLTGRLGKFYSPTGRTFIRAAVTGFEHVPILSWPIGWAD